MDTRVIAGNRRLHMRTRHTSHITRHTSHVTRHTSHFTRHTSHVTRHTSHVTLTHVSFIITAFIVHRRHHPSFHHTQNLKSTDASQRCHTSTLTQITNPHALLQLRPSFLTLWTSCNSCTGCGGGAGCLAHNFGSHCLACFGFLSCMLIVSFMWQVRGLHILPCGLL